MTTPTSNNKNHECKHDTDIALLQQKYDSIYVKLEKIDKALSGNGTRGLKARLDMIQGAIVFAYFLIMAMMGVLTFSIG